ncbi:MAG TPA: hypothetical protein VMX16_19560, partial [Terriglobia bacterium]|nr:hypothetical protein [Terriglobia bacterium]
AEPSKYKLRMVIKGSALSGRGAFSLLVRRPLSVGLGSSTVSGAHRAPLQQTAPVTRLPVLGQIIPDHAKLS